MTKQVLIQTDNIHPAMLHFIDIDPNTDTYATYLDKIYDKFGLENLRNSTKYKLVIYSSQSGVLHRVRINETNWMDHNNAWLYVY
jgi:hypothetical protein